MILVCSLSRVEEMVARYKPGRVISLLDPDHVFPDLGSAYGGKHLQLRFHDVLEAAAGEIAPSTEHIDHLLRFIRAAGRDADLLIHCRAGISRSTAAAFIASCCLYPDVPERTLALALRRASPVARPNQTMIALADTAMARDGRMTAAISSTAEDIPWITLDEGQAFELRCPDRDT
jgi:predicted protein tyrosine phosphatase